MASPVESETGTSREDNPMPIFVEVTQTTTMAGASPQQPSILVGATVFSFDPASRVLLLRPTIPASPTTELLIGVTTVLQMPGEVYEKRAIVQFPSAQPALFQILAFDAKAGTLDIDYAGESRTLSPGESLTFKKIGAGTKAPTVITLFVNHGRLADIQPLSPDGTER